MTYTSTTSLGTNGFE